MKLSIYILVFLISGSLMASEAADLCPPGTLELVREKAELVIRDSAKLQSGDDYRRLAINDFQHQDWMDQYQNSLPRYLEQTKEQLETKAYAEDLLNVWSRIKNSPRLLGDFKNANYFVMTFRHSGMGLANANIDTLSVNLDPSFFDWLYKNHSAETFSHVATALLSHELSHFLVDWHHFQIHGHNYIGLPEAPETLHMSVDMTALKLTGQSLENFSAAFAIIQAYGVSIGQLDSDIPTRINCYQQSN